MFQPDGKQWFKDAQFIGYTIEVMQGPAFLMDVVVQWYNNGHSVYVHPMTGNMVVRRHWFAPVDEPMF